MEKENSKMNVSIVNINSVQQDFEYVDSLIRAHTNTAIAKVNAEQLQMYWEIGGYISQHLKDASWGDHVVSRPPQAQREPVNGYDSVSFCRQG